MSSPRRFKDNIYVQLARIGKAMAAPKRLELLDLLAQAPCTVEVLAEQAAISTANASQHLHVLRAAGLVLSEKQGLYVTYRLASDQVSNFAVAMRGLAESQLVEVEQVARGFLKTRDALEAIDEDELVGRVRRREVTILDVRPAAEFAAGHIPGALSVPLPALKSMLATLPKDREVVAYCRGPYCVMAIEAVTQLRKQGFTAHRLELGVADWRARGWRVAAQAAS